VHRIILSGFGLAFFFLTAALNLSAQGTAISYQGRLNVSGSPANTNYDFRFTVYDAVTNGNAVSIALTNYAVPVSNGLFSVILNFGPGVFNGTDNGSNDWMDIGVRAIGVTPFTVLSPRQPILPVPYAIFATSASNLLGGLSATQIVGTISSSVLSGTYTNTVNFLNGTNLFAGSFSGNGGGLTNLNGSQIATGTIADARLASDVALLDTNQTFTGSNNFTGPGNYSGANTFSGADTFTGPNTFTGSGGYSGVNTFTNVNNYFEGNFFGNGLVGWLPVSGTATNAMRDAGYLLLNASLTTVTLPATASLSVGDIVRISGGGGGGWLVKENSGQSIVGNFASYRNCNLNQVPLAGTADCQGVAATADGVRMYVVGTSLTGVYAATDPDRDLFQVSSTGATGLAGDWYSVACSANGAMVYAEPYTGGTIQMSTNGGVNWSASSYSGPVTFISCNAAGSVVFPNNYACSGNGTYLAREVSGVISISSNGGSSWNNVATAPASGVNCLGASSDCTRLVAAVNPGLLYVSSNMGQSWTTLTATNQPWSGAWMSPDGSKFAATFRAGSGIAGGIYYCNVSALPNTSSTASTGSLCGSQGSAVELQYVGGGQFSPASSTGLIWAN
jgi:hypothetical protein